MEPQPPYPRDKETLLQEVAARIRVRDIQMLHRFQDRVAIKWWESSLVILLFVSALGFLLTVSRLLPEQLQGSNWKYWFVFFWLVGLTVSIIAVLEFILLKFHALRRLHETSSRILESLQKDIEALRSKVSATADEVESNTPKNSKDSPEPKRQI